MRQLLIALIVLLSFGVSAQTGERTIVVAENVAYRTDVGPSTVLDLAKPQFGPQTNRPAILIIHGGGWSAGSKNEMVYRALMIDYAMKGYVVANMNYRLIQEAAPPWLDWQLKGHLEPKALFLDGNLTGYDKWTIKQKNFK